MNQLQAMRQLLDKIKEPKDLETARRSILSEKEKVEKKLTAAKAAMNPLEVRLQELATQLQQLDAIRTLSGLSPVTPSTVASVKGKPGPKPKGKPGPKPKTDTGQKPATPASSNTLSKPGPKPKGKPGPKPKGKPGPKPGFKKAVQTDPAAALPPTVSALADPAAEPSPSKAKARKMKPAKPAAKPAAPAKAVAKPKAVKAKSETAAPKKAAAKPAVKTADPESTEKRAAAVERLALKMLVQEPVVSAKAVAERAIKEGIDLLVSRGHEGVAKAILGSSTSVRRVKGGFEMAT